MLTRLWDNERFRNWFGQLLLAAACLSLIAWIYTNTVGNLASRGIKVGPEFLFRPANFPISESILPYNPSDPFWWAYVVGLGNTVFISVLAIAFATVLGLVVGLARRSGHPLVSAIAGTFVAMMRNMPLIVQLLFWYALATTTFPAPREAWNPLPGVFLTLRGVYIPGFQLGPSGALFVSLALLGLVAAVFAAPMLNRRLNLGVTLSLLSTLSIYVLCISLLWTGLDLQPLATWPELRGLNFVGGFRLSAEFTALMLGLVIYTSAFIGEIIRGGIDAVSKGQWEAARALGLRERQTLFKIIMPQALRVIIPPLTTQYLSTVKNTTLALAVGFPELGLIVGTVINQTGQAIESILILLAVFLSVSLSVSFFMNWYNARVALVVR
ncbi:amino acid ABC transporter permease [Phyllobacterium phragmitis]|uniref:Amino acid ABC transporter permease n=1 Tax=Phyllobacterium phragmitis TaxID=2670329 RepID=A0A2S9IRH4_9HYPH|nr:ABC transporter permease subunit [Phyllobacterium phragmitis]PRD43119.1 amino acid ABC transporter permease [Phyllobacterium phragmitis]